MLSYLPSDVALNTLFPAHYFAPEVSLVVYFVSLNDLVMSCEGNNFGIKIPCDQTLVPSFSLPIMSSPDAQIFPHATGAAADTVSKHQEPQDLVFYSGWVSGWLLEWIVSTET